LTNNPFKISVNVLRILTEQIADGVSRLFNGVASMSAFADCQLAKDLSVTFESSWHQHPKVYRIVVGRSENEQCVHQGMAEHFSTTTYLTVDNWKSRTRNIVAFDETLVAIFSSA
jgi:hypothetical protein